VRREEKIQPSVIVLFIQRSSCKGSIESGVEPIAFGICNRSVGLAPIGRRNRQITAHSAQATRSACCQCAAENGQTVRHDDDGDRRDLPHRCALYLLDLGIKIVALGLVPEGRRASSATAWLLLILFLPLIGLLAFWLIGNPFVDRGRRRRQAAAGQVISGALTEESNNLLPVPVGSTLNTLVGPSI
jgi:Phospholipase_D-nuclease N-terminal